MTEVIALATTLKVEKFHLLYWDGKIEGHEVYDSTTIKNIKVNTDPRGGGGTTPACVPKYLKEKGINPDCVIMLTDGDVWGWGEWKHPVLWAIYNPHKTITAPVGKTIHIEDN